VIRNRRSELDTIGVEVIASVQVVIGHELKEILQVGFVGLELSFHDYALLEQVRQSGHNDGIEHVDLEEVTVANMEAIEGHALDECDPGDEACIFSILVASIANSKRMIDGKMKSINEGTNCDVDVSIELR
jgi:hypothetical protein